jgi:hypothetical protein
MQIPLTVRLEAFEVEALTAGARQKKTSRHNFAKLVLRAGLSQLAISGECGDRAIENSKIKTPA